MATGDSCSFRDEEVGRIPGHINELISEFGRHGWDIVMITDVGEEYDRPEILADHAGTGDAVRDQGF